MKCIIILSFCLSMFCVSFFLNVNRSCITQNHYKLPVQVLSVQYCISITVNIQIGFIIQATVLTNIIAKQGSRNNKKSEITSIFGSKSSSYKKDILFTKHSKIKKNYSLKVLYAIILLVYFLSQKENICETKKNVFYFTSRGPLVLKKIKF